MDPLTTVERYILRFFYACIAYALIGFSWGAIQSGVPVIRHFLEAPPARFIILAHGHINLLGWVEMAIFGATYYIIPRILRRPIASERLVKVHFWTHNLGLVMMVAGFFVAGYTGGRLFWEGAADQIMADFYRPVLRDVRVSFEGFEAGATYPSEVGTLAVGEMGASNAGFLAARILALGDPALRERLESHRADMVKGVLEKDAKVRGRSTS